MYSPDNFLNLFQGKDYSTEEELENDFKGKITGLFNISSQRLKSQHLTTSFDKRLSNKSDVIIWGEDDPDLALVIFELKIEKSIRQFKKGSYEDAKKQLHLYCQDMRAAYGVLLSEKKCWIFRYDYRGSKTSHTEVKILPLLNQIENEMTASVSEEVDLRRMAKRKDGIEKGLLEKSAQIRLETNSRLGKERERHKKLLKFYTFMAMGAVVIFFIVGGYFYKGAACDIKGNTSQNGDKIYHTKESPSYSKVKIDPKYGEKMFCSEKEAVNAGFRKWQSK
ncbi:MAG: hypothetical protein Q7S53_05605 [bacterium]|nr:hypothetical protein [bacterium]